MFIDLNEVPERELLKGFKVRFVHSEHMTFAYWQIAAGAVLPDHAHPHEQVANIISGEFELTINGVSRRLVAGTVAIIPSHAQHHGLALTDCQIIDVFYPIREDYLRVESGPEK